MANISTCVEYKWKKELSVCTEMMMGPKTCFEEKHAGTKELRAPCGAVDGACCPGGVSHDLLPSTPAREKSVAVSMATGSAVREAGWLPEVVVGGTAGLEQSRGVIFKHGRDKGIVADPAEEETLPVDGKKKDCAGVFRWEFGPGQLLPEARCRCRGLL
ncbi:hypothetical protein AMECASPLE_038753 [Ameca splendens]|uniref:Uncharacterized protein n=1 Tax=Ameca splendens TaxID=208324 RepID=A0ABV1A4S7_9TELE